MLQELRLQGLIKRSKIVKMQSPTFGLMNLSTSLMKLLGACKIIIINSTISNHKLHQMKQELLDTKRKLKISEEALKKKETGLQTTDLNSPLLIIKSENSRDN